MVLPVCFYHKIYLFFPKSAWFGAFFGVLFTPLDQLPLFQNNNERWTPAQIAELLHYWVPANWANQQLICSVLKECSVSRSGMYFIPFAQAQNKHNAPSLLLSAASRVKLGQMATDALQQQTMQQ